MKLSGFLKDMMSVQATVMIFNKFRLSFIKSYLTEMNAESINNDKLQTS